MEILKNLKFPGKIIVEYVLVGVIILLFCVSFTPINLSIVLFKIAALIFDECTLYILFWIFKQKKFNQYLIYVIMFIVISIGITLMSFKY